MKWKGLKKSQYWHTSISRNFSIFTQIEKVRIGKIEIFLPLLWRFHKIQSIQLIFFAKWKGHKIKIDTVRFRGTFQRKIHWFFTPKWKDQKSNKCDFLEIFNRIQIFLAYWKGQTSRFRGIFQGKSYDYFRNEINVWRHFAIIWVGEVNGQRVGHLFKNLLSKCQAKVYHTKMFTLLQSIKMLTSILAFFYHFLEV